MLGTILNPRNDLTFKRIFGTERNKDNILLPFLNDVLGPSRGKVIREVSLIQTEQLVEIDALRESAVDVMCTDAHGNRFIVEMQVEREAGFEKRVQYYAAKAYIEQRGKDTGYKDLKEVIFIAVLDHVLFPDKEASHSYHQIRDVQTCAHDLKDFSFFFMELGKFRKDVHHLEGMLEKWMYFLKNGEDMSPEEFRALVAGAPVMARALEEANRVNWTPEQLRAYDSVDKRRFFYRDTVDAAIQKGIAEGKVQAFAEVGLSAEEIVQRTGIAPETVRRILEGMAP
jgi:predicted transposase/invertase (TIGR01784 family)